MVLSIMRGVICCLVPIGMMFKLVALLQAQVLALHVTMPELTTLVTALDRLDDYQQRAKECLRYSRMLASPVKTTPSKCLICS